MQTRVIRQLFKDSVTLQDYLSGTMPSAGTVKRRALVLERTIDHRLPDHVYRNWRDGLIGDHTEIWPILRSALDLYAERYVRFCRDRTFIEFHRFGDWQHELARLSPLPIIAYAIYRQFRSPGPDVMRIDGYAQRHLRQFQHTVLITPMCQPVDDLIARKGLYETHLHLNGSTEVDKIWQDALSSVDAFAAKLEDALPEGDPGSGSSAEMVLELYDQLGMRSRAADVPRQLLLARRLRLAMALQVFKRPGVRPSRSLPAMLAALTSMDFEEGVGTYRHPIETNIGNVVQGRLAQEILLLILVYERLDRGGDDQLARALHVYLLVLNATFVPLCVQQAEQFGFEQFQKFTFNGIRWLSEADYTARFHQLAHTATADIAFIEGRFAPPVDLDGLKASIRTILSGYYRYLRESKILETAPEDIDLTSGEDAPRPRRMDLRLTVHFIKQNELARLDPAAGCRFSRLRLDIERRWQHLRLALDELPQVRHYLTGIDAAANELHTPPEVFAPLYRAARRAGLVHFTYHVGEDFEHLITGIRAVYEAVTFLGLRDGNRLGHGTAVGIAPEIWLERVPAKLRLRRGDRLDDLVFAYRLLLDEPLATGVLGRLQDEIQRLARAVYREELDCYVLWTAWTLRHYDPLRLADTEQSLWWSPVDDQTEEWRLLREEREKTRAAYDVFRRYHQPDVVERSRVFEQESADILSAVLLRLLQERVLQEITRRRVVIETLPTSNVRISFYKDFSEHHVLRWLGLRGDGHRPSVSVGSDDPGIFACSLRGEFMHLYREILKQTGSEQEALARLEHLNEVGRIYRFT
ncbi:hypothetical protein [Azospirillum sp.]|uniref:hypothetical protein n=1 Tax=Azospirillum sp. TaxID=34012 RepID=UPI003D739223